jgi:hypothetical protein
VLLASWLAAAPAGALDLPALLDGARQNARATVPVRADVVFTRGETRTPAVLLLWRNVVYLETAGGFRALARGAKAVVVQDGHPARAPLRAQIPATDVLVEELPFEGTPLAFPLIQDEPPDGVVVAGAPAGESLYVLIVRTIDPERHTVTVTKYYKDDIATLFKIRQDRGFVQVDGHWRPTEVEVQDYPAQSTTRLTLTWKVAPDLPRTLFTPAALRRPSGLTFPASG